MKNKLKLLFRWALTFLLCLAVIYAFVFFGGWQLFQSGDPLLMEVGAALVLSIFVFVANEAVTGLTQRIKALEERMAELEKKT
ncbi:MAG: hypothetical protein IKL89_04065 [Clostridia bacterium]|nr:hypothetical protein [Clostridia bacterium]